VAEVLTILAALALNWPLPLIAVQILWLNLVTDSAQVLALAVEPGEPDVMRRPPRGRGVGVLSRRLWERVVLSGAVMTAGTLFLYRWDLDATGSEMHARTVALTTMVLFQMYQAVNMRSETRSVFHIPPLSNPYLFAAIAVSLTIHLAALYIGPTQVLLRVEPIELMSWLRIIVVAATILVVVEIHKRIRRNDPDAQPRYRNAQPSPFQAG
jgi:Ca2+-transporting ATPase